MTITEIITKLNEEGYVATLNSNYIKINKDNLETLLYINVQQFIVNNETKAVGYLVCVEYDLTDNKVCLELPDWLTDMLLDHVKVDPK